MKVVVAVLLLMFLSVFVGRASAYAQECEQRPDYTRQINPIITLDRAMGFYQLDEIPDGEHVLAMGQVFDLTEASDKFFERMARVPAPKLKRVHTTNHLNNFIRGTVRSTGEQILDDKAPAIIVGYNDDDSEDPDAVVGSFLEKLGNNGRLTAEQLREISLTEDSTYMVTHQKPSSVFRFGRFSEARMDSNMAITELRFEDIIFRKLPGGEIFEGTTREGETYRIVVPASIN